MMDLPKPPAALGPSDVLSQMERDWDNRAREAPEYYIATGQRQWSPEEFFASGEVNVDNEIRADANFIGRGKSFGRMRVLEIGCGAGRMTRALASLFAEVHAVDISAEMIALARRNLADLKNVFLYKNNGCDLAGLADGVIDFAFSFIVFQHIPSRDVIEGYVREVHRCMKPGGIFKFQVRSRSDQEELPYDSWNGVPISLAEAEAIAARCGFDLIAASGEGSQYFWLWFLKPGWTRIFPRNIRTSLRSVVVRVRNAFEVPVRVVFFPPVVEAGNAYRVYVPGFAGQVIDVSYEMRGNGTASPITGVVCRWCELDAKGDASISLSPEHPAAVVRIAKIRSLTKNGPWRNADGTIQVVAARKVV